MGPTCLKKNLIEDIEIDFSNQEKKKSHKSLHFFCFIKKVNTRISLNIYDNFVRMLYIFLD